MRTTITAGAERHGYVHAEWIDGEISYMAPAGAVHDDAAWWIGTLLRHYVDRKKLGRVKLDTWTKFQKPRPQVRGPDVAFVAKARVKIITTRNISQPPDFVIEVVSPGDESRDYRDKFLLYETSGVREYWIVDPASESVEAYHLNKKRKYVRYVSRSASFRANGGLIRRWLDRLLLHHLDRQLRHVHRRAGLVQ